MDSLASFFQSDVPLKTDRVGEVMQACLDVECCPILVEVQYRCHHFSSKMSRQVQEISVQCL